MTIPQNVSNPVRRVMEQAQDLDDRRQNQIHNQIAAINRLAFAMEVGEAWSYTDEMQALHELLARAQTANADIIERAREVAGDAVNYDHAARTFAEDVLELLGIHTSSAPAEENKKEKS